MYKRRRSNRYGTPQPPRSRPSTVSPISDIAGTKTTKFNRKLYRLLPAHEEKVEEEIKKLLDSMKLKALHNNLSPRRTGGIPLTDNTLSSYEKHFDFRANVKVYTRDKIVTKPGFHCEKKI